MIVQAFEDFTSFYFYLFAVSRRRAQAKLLVEQNAMLPSALKDAIEVRMR